MKDSDDRLNGAGLTALFPESCSEDDIFQEVRDCLSPTAHKAPLDRLSEIGRSGPAEYSEPTRRQD